MNASIGNARHASWNRDARSGIRHLTDGAAVAKERGDTSARFDWRLASGPTPSASERRSAMNEFRGTVCHEFANAVTRIYERLAMNNPSPLEELERLKAEYDAADKLFSGENGDRHYERWQTARTMLVCGMQEHFPFLLAAAREAETLREDAERYRWLREWCDINFDDDGTFSDLENSYGTPNPKTEFTARLQAKLDAAIDAARKGQGE